MTLIFPDQEVLMTGYLREYLPEGTFVGRTRPVQSRPRIVTVRRQGGQGARALKRLDTVRLGVNVWADSEKAANDLAALVQAILMQAGDDGTVKNLDTTGYAEIEDDTSQHRRYFTVDYTARGSALATTT